MSKTKRLVLILFVILVCAGCDQSTKYLASNSLEFNAISSFAGDLFRLHYVENKGAFLGIGGGLGEQERFVIFTLFVAFFIGSILVYTVVGKELTVSDVIAYSLIAGGGLSNLYDRVANNGAVVDFLNIGIGSLRTGIFNLADVFIMLGLFMLLSHLLFPKKAELGKLN